jgi:hypothetical protein
MDGEVASPLGEAESDDLSAGPPESTWWDRSVLAGAVRAHPTVATFVALVGLAAASAMLHQLLADWVNGPRVFMDELGYERMAQTFAHTGHFKLFGKTGLAYSPLYPIVLSPLYRLTSIQSAYGWAKVENAVLLSLSVFPVYGIARAVLPRGRSVGVAALSLIAPLMLYSGFEMSESLAYPLCLVAIWVMLRALRRPSVINDALLLGAILLAPAARLQLVALVPAALTAVALVALLREPRPEESRGRALMRAISTHWLLFGTVVAGLIAVVVRRAMNGGALPLAGRYSAVGTAHASPLRTFELFFQHLADLDFAVGVIPFAAALLTGYVLVRSGFPRRQLIFASVAAATTLWMLLEVAFDAAAFDATSSHPRHVSGPFDVPRIHERYLIYVMPLFFVALVVALPLLRRKFPQRWHLAFAAVAAALPLLIPFNTVVNITSAFESFALQPFAKIESGSIVPIPHPTFLALILSALMAVGYLRAAARPLPSLAVAMTAVALLGLSLLALERQTVPIAQAGLGLPSHKDWVDRAIGGQEAVSLVGGAGVDTAALEETAFWNASVSRVYYTCTLAFGTDYGEEQLTLDRGRGVLRGPAGALRARYAVVPAAFGVPGRILARDRPGKLVLVAPAGGALRIPSGSRAQVSCGR